MPGSQDLGGLPFPKTGHETFDRLPGQEIIVGAQASPQGCAQRKAFFQTVRFVVHKRYPVEPTRSVAICSIII
jgi:hypothetical protein